MPMTITEKILAAHCGKKQVEPGEFINVKYDLIMANDSGMASIIPEFEKIGVPRVAESDKIYIVLDHFVPSRDIASANYNRRTRQFVKEQGIKNFFEVGRSGIEHALLPDEGFVLPGDLVVGGDSHTTTYGAVGAFSTGLGHTDMAVAMALGEVWLRVPKSIKFIYNGKPKNKWVMGKDLILHTIGDIGTDGALYQAMEFTGEAIENLSMDGRLTICNMAVEAGAKNGIVAPDETTVEYVKARGKTQYHICHSDRDAEYAEVHQYDVTDLKPQVAVPYLPSNAQPAEELSKVNIDQAFVGSCTNGRLEDLRVTAEVLGGKKVHRDVRLIVIPATSRIHLQALREGLAEVIVEAGGAFSTPTCGPCPGGHMGVIGDGECCVATTNRNFVGRMGHTNSKVYLANAAVVAASAIKGRIAVPEEVS